MHLVNMSIDADEYPRNKNESILYLDKQREDNMGYHRYKNKPGGYYRGRSRYGGYYTYHGCYIATCVYGSYDCPQVWVLRRFRDQYLQKALLGRLFIRSYYFISPKLVSVFGNEAWFHNVSKKVLDRIVCILENKGYSSSPYFDEV